MTILQDTTGAELLRQLAAERRNDGVASGLALTLIVSFDSAHMAEVEDAVTHAAAAHPCRLLLVSRMNEASRYRDRLDAEVIVGGRLGGCEAAIMQMQGRLALHADSVVLPLLAPDVPVVTWWHGPPPERIATDPLGVAADRRITDSSLAEDPVASLRQRAADYVGGDTDLAWTRVTGWRTLLAAALDGAEGGRPVSRATVTAARSDASAALLAGWLRARLGVAPRRVDSASGTLESVALDLAGGGSVTVTRDGGSAVLARTGQQDRLVPLLTPTLGELVAEELRRLHADASYAEALSAATGVTDLDRRPARRVHLWLDPEEVR